MRRMWAAGAAIVMCLVLGAVPVGAQSPSPQDAAAWVTGTVACLPRTEGTPSTVDGVVQVRGLVLDCTLTMSDPRVSGTAARTYNEDCHPGVGCVTWGSVEATLGDGTWVGSFDGIVDASRQAATYNVFEGTGTYAGWTYVAQATGGLGEPVTVVGLLYQGPPPPSAGAR